MKKIGIIGGGQLGKMMILDAKKLDYYFIILDPTKDCPADSIADEHIVAGFDDLDAMVELAKKVDVVTYEFEHINAKALQQIEAQGIPVYPSSKTLLQIQNKYTQKEWMKKHQLPVPRYEQVSSIEDIKMVSKSLNYPLILKTCTGGYDGKGNAVIKDEHQVEAAFHALGANKIPLMVEEYLPFEKEVSVLVCQSENGQVIVFPVAENEHKNSILDETTVPANISNEVANRVMELAKETTKVFEAIGMLCIELFIMKDGAVLINELAPRPHNSGHYTIEGCYSSQYENHIRAIVGLPLGNPNLIRPTVMKNIIGTTDGVANVQGLKQAYSCPDVQVHIYGKKQVAIGRKMGHITVTADTIEDALKQARFAHEQISFEG